MYDDGLLLQLNQERLQKVMAPKVIGAWNLHTLTLNSPLDFFVLFSSITSLVGNPGQGNYVAANAFLDALAHYRRGDGLPALTINWGAVDDVGYVAKNREVGQHLQRIGMSALPPQQLLERLGQLLKSGAVQTAIAPMDWQKWAQKHAVGTSPRFSHLIMAKHPHGTIIPAEQATDVEEGGEKVNLASISKQVARVLGTSPTKIDSQQPLTNLGLDSLMGVELANRLKSKLGVDVPAMKLISGMSVAELAAELSDGKRLAKPYAKM